MTETAIMHCKVVDALDEQARIVYADYLEELGEEAAAARWRHMRLLEIPLSNMATVRLDAMLTGSTAFPSANGAPPMDRDYLVWAPYNFVQIALQDEYWIVGGSFPDEVLENFRFWSLHYDGNLDEWENVNLIVTHDAEFCLAWINAHNECMLNPPMDKAGRIAVFDRHGACKAPQD